MPKVYISVPLRRTVQERARGCCEYCKAPVSHCPGNFHIDHIIPVSKGGLTILENLAYSCGGCNPKKSAKTTATDPATGQKIPLFHPRKDDWNDHFKWDENKLHIIGITLKGELTIQTLDMNRQGLINLRGLLKEKGLHPPV